MTGIIDAYRDRGLGTPINQDVLLRAGVSESLAPRTAQALRLLELVDEAGNPTPQFEAMRQARGEEEFRSILQEWLRATFADVLQYTDPSNDAADRVAEAFRGYTPPGQRARMATLLIGLWQYAGLPVPEAKRTPSDRPARVRRPAKQSVNLRPATTTRNRNDGSSLSGLPAGLVGLLHQIPQGGASWTSDRRKEFLTAFTAVLDFSVPVDDSTPKDPIEEGTT